MKKFTSISINALIFLLLPLASSFAQNTADIKGNWLAIIESNGMKMRFVVKVSKTAELFTAKFDSLDQGASDLEIDTITQQDKVVRFEAKKYFLSYEGTLNEKGDEISGTFKQGGASLPLLFKRVGEIPKISRSQEPQKPYPYDEEEVSYKNLKDDVKLAGTLTLPRTGRPHPAVILITGSGGQDRNETVAGHRPFLVLADYLTRKGIAVLRVDDRGVGGSDSGSPTATSENYAGDVLAGVTYLLGRKEINPKSIGLIGHSEGGMIAPMVAAQSKDVGFIILLAGPGQTGEDVIYTQTELLQKAGGNSQNVIANNVSLMKNVIAILKAEPNNKIAESRIRETLEKQASKMNEAQAKAFAPAKARMEAQFPMFLSAWFRYFVAFDPHPVLKKITVPVLALNGENDLQVSAKENLDLIAAALKAGGNRDFTVKSFAKLNHLFQTSQTGAPSEYDKIEETMSPQVLAVISDWILKRAMQK
jgi:uncharacterized protein